VSLSGPSLGTSKLICLNRNFSSIYIACLTCTTKIESKTPEKKPGPKLDHMYFKPLIEFDASFISKITFDVIWSYYHSTMNYKCHFVIMGIFDMA